jgi:hypothetical protein
VADHSLPPCSLASWPDLPHPSNTYNRDWPPPSTRCATFELHITTLVVPRYNTVATCDGNAACRAPATNCLTTQFIMDIWRQAPIKNTTRNLLPSFNNKCTYIGFILGSYGDTNLLSQKWLYQLYENLWQY